MNSTPPIGSPLIVVVVNRSWRETMSAAEVYEVAQGSWRVGADVRREAKVVIAVAQRRVVGAYEIDGWSRSMESQDTRDRQVVKFAFTGTIAEDLQYLLGTYMESLPTPNQSSFLKFLDGYPG